MTLNRKSLPSKLSRKAVFLCSQTLRAKFMSQGATRPSKNRFAISPAAVRLGALGRTLGFDKADSRSMYQRNYKKSSRLNIGDDEASPRQIFFAERNDDLCDGRTLISTKSTPIRQHAVSESHCNIERSTGEEIGYGLPN